MAKEIVKTSPLDGLAPPKGKNVTMAERVVGKVTLRGNSDDPKFLKATKDVLGVDLPVEPLTYNEGGAYTAHWVGPNEWMIYTPEDGQTALVGGLQKALDGQVVQVLDVSDYYTVIRLSGPAAREVLMKGTPLDIHPRSFKVGQCTGTLYVHSDIFLSLRDDAPVFDVQIRWSHADYLWDYFVEAAKEFG